MRSLIPADYTFRVSGNRIHPDLQLRSQLMGNIMVNGINLNSEEMFISENVPKCNKPDYVYAVSI